MQQTLLSTKFNTPALGYPLVPRDRLIETLAQAAARRVTLVAAPPGYGKTTLVGSWLRGVALPYTWLSLDESDNDPTRFLEYFLTALHRVVPAIRPDALDLLQGQKAVSYPAFMAQLINEAAGVGEFVVVLDDFHVLHAPLILDMLIYLFERLPPTMHVVLLSRTDPALPFARLRACGQLLEIRVEQLRFTTGEITHFFAKVMEIALSASDISAIEARTEGWIAGLQLAGLAMQNTVASRDSSLRAGRDSHNFIAAFTGSHTYIMDYLTEEVLRSQPERTRAFLLQTSILDRVCGPLCEAVSGSGGQVDGQAMLESIERGHLFVVPLDGERRWYRYHHLFREVLSRRLEVVAPGEISGLHRRASEWFEQHGLIHEAVQHAMLEKDLDRIVRLVEQHGCALLMGGELVTLAAWLAAIEPHTRTHPWLAMQKAWVLALSGQLERAEETIKDGEQLLSNLELTDEVRTLRGSLAAARACCANTQGNTHLAARYALQAIDLLGVGGDFSCALRSVATSLLGDATWAQGNLVEARRAYAEAVQIGRLAGNPHMTMLSANSLADVCFELGQLNQAARLYSETLQTAEQVDGPNSSYAQSVYFGLSQVYYAWNRLDEAATASEACLRVSRQWGNANLQGACLALAARIHLTRGDGDKAREAAAAAEEWLEHQSPSSHWSMWTWLTLARFWLDQGESEKALLLIHNTRALPEGFLPEMAFPEDFLRDVTISYRLEAAYVLLARLLLTRDSPDAVLVLTGRLLPEVQAAERGKTLTELLVLQALAYQSKKDLSSALEVLEKALALAWPDQAVRVFLDEGERMAKLLYQAKARGPGAKFIENILSCFARLGGSESSPTGAFHNQAAEPEVRRANSMLIEPLSLREVEVLRAIAEGCSNQEIAARLVLSPKTVKRHISNIFAKLEAKNRTRAVALARTLGLVE